MESFVCHALAEHLLLTIQQKDTAGVLPQPLALQHALMPFKQGISADPSTGTEGESPAGRGSRRVRGNFAPAVCVCCLAVAIPAVAGQTLLLTSGVLLHALVTLSTHVGVGDGKLLAICVVLLQRRLLVGAGWCQRTRPSLQSF